MGACQRAPYHTHTYLVAIFVAILPTQEVTMTTNQLTYMDDPCALDRPQGPKPPQRNSVVRHPHLSRIEEVILELFGLSD
jgi:hypothetical protein